MLAQLLPSGKRVALADRLPDIADQRELAELLDGCDEHGKLGSAEILYFVYEQVTVFPFASVRQKHNPGFQLTQAKEHSVDAW